MKLDLHIHTTASDGSWSPAAVVQAAVEGGLDVIAITDHDTTAAVTSAQEAAGSAYLQVIPGIEVSSTYVGRDIHVLGYFVDPESDAMQGHAVRAGRRREVRMKEMIKRLEAQGVYVTFSDVERAAGPDRVVIGRPHLAKALVEAGYASSLHETFRTLIGDNSDAFVPMQLLNPMDAIDLILASGGVPMWAHPPADMLDGLLPLMKEAGLMGLEVYRPRTKRSDLLRLESICKSTGLLMSGGSDWHNPDYGTVLGDFYVDAAEIETLLRVGGL